MMKTILSTMLVLVVFGVTTSASAKLGNTIVCPGIKTVTPFVKNITPVPFPQCAYMGASRLKSKVNHCKQVRKKLTEQFNQKLQGWRCHYDSANKNSYFFTFESLKSK